ncbi:hypothetical protein LJR090_001467 [Bosea sp. LjRoot90]|uniref:hypothetical protein n=1 Tax=Bosea sp. LjRoot90 TaxID=3342342 RepID=UPI003ED16A64
MPDKVVQTQGNGSPERVALELLVMIAQGQNKDITGYGSVDKEWILDTYAECLAATSHQRRPKSG